MKLRSFALMAAGTFLVGGCETKRTTAPVAEKAAPPIAKTAPEVERRTVEFQEKSEADVREHYSQWAREGWSVLSISGRLAQPDGTVHRKADLFRDNAGAEPEAAYNDRRIAMIKRGETTEAQLLEWFGPPESRVANPDGRDQLSWSFSGETPHSGVLNVSLEPEGKVEAYSAHGQAMHPSGTGFTYDDGRVARITRGQTTETQLVEWFGPPEARNVKSDGRQQLSWTFARTTDGKSARAAALQISLAPDGNVDAYSSRR